MKIAIYGDSFGAYPICMKDYQGYEYVGNAWWEHLAETYNITNYCEWSASLLFSTDQFLKTHHNFDKIIFLVTHPGRITVKHNDSYRHFVNYEYSTFWKKDAKKDNWTELLSAVLMHYQYIANDEYSLLQHKSYINLIKQERPDAHLIPCFKNSIDNTVNNLCDIFLKEQQHWKIDYDVGKWDIRKGHLSKENNYILYKCIVEMLTYGVLDIDLDKFTYPALPKEKYIL